MAVKISTSFGDVNPLKSQIPVNLLVENVIIVAYENQLIKIIGYVFGSRQTKTAKPQPVSRDREKMVRSKEFFINNDVLVDL